jgi:hypothetical protein
MNSYAWGQIVQGATGVAAIIFFVKLMERARHGRARVAGGRQILAYSTLMQFFAAIALLGSIAIGVFYLLLLFSDLDLIRTDTKLVIGTLILILPIECLMFILPRSVFGTAISFDETGIYRKMIGRPEEIMSWSEIASFHGEGQIEVVDRRGRRIVVSQYRNGGDDLIAELRTHGIPCR